MSEGPLRAAWLIPVRNGATWLGEAVRSALADSDSADEVIVVDDGSTDDPASALPQDPRVRLFSRPAAGIVAALEFGRRQTTAPLLARLDCDDVVLPGRLAAQRALLAERPELAAVGGQARAICDSGEAPLGMRLYVEWVNSLEDPARELLVESPMFHPATTLRATAVEEVGGYRHGAFPEDYDLFLRLSRAGYSLYNLRQEVLAWRDRPGRLTRTDPRYARAAFMPLKQAWLVDRILPERRRVVVWGANASGGPWIRWLLDAGHDVPFVLDIGAMQVRHGRPVRRPEAIVGEVFDVLLVAVGARGARAEIRARLAALRPDLQEGRDWFAVE